MELKVCLIYLSGSKKGKIECFIDGPVSLGTGKENVSIFRKGLDRKVSLKHAIISSHRGKIYLSDAGSKTGTYVNGDMISQRMELRDWDIVELGKNGVKFIFRLSETPSLHPETGDVLDEELMQMINDSLLKIKGKKEGKIAPSNIFFRQLIDRSVKRSTRRFKIIISLMTILVCVVIGLWIKQTLQQRDLERERVEKRIVAINQDWSAKLADVDRKNADFSNTASARESNLRAQVTALQDQLKTAQDSKSSESKTLRSELRRVQRELGKTRRELMKNTRTDFVQIARKNQSAVLLIMNRYQVFDKKSGQPIMITGKNPQGQPIFGIGGSVGIPFYLTATGTGFNVSQNGTVLTNKHVVKPWNVQPFFINNNLTGKITKLSIIFADTDDWIDVKIDKESARHDIVVLKIKKPVRKYPYLKKIHTNVASLQQGEEIAVIGFPANVKTDGKAVTTLTVGVLSKAPLKEDLQFNAQINPGNSGGPLFNGRGEVIGIVYGAGVASSGIRLHGISYAIPIKYGMELIGRK